MTIEQAILKATEAGYKSHYNKEAELWVKEAMQYMILLDRDFWKAFNTVLVRHADYRERWSDYWHKFIDHLVDGNSAESFFAQWK